MDGIILGTITIALILSLIYYILARSSRKNMLSKGNDHFPEQTDDQSKVLTSDKRFKRTEGSNLFPGQFDDPSDALTSNVRFEHVEGLMKRDFPAEKHAEVVDALGKYAKGYKATVYHIILGEAKGNIEKVKEFVKIANEVGDYRDLAQALIHMKSN